MGGRQNYIGDRSEHHERYGADTDSRAVLLLTPYSRAHVGTVTSRMGGGHRFGRTHRRMSTRTCTLLLHTSRVDYSSTLYRDLPRSTERYGADTDSESDAEELTRTCQSQTRIQTHAHMSESDAEELTRTCQSQTRRSSRAHVKVRRGYRLTRTCQSQTRSSSRAHAAAAHVRVRTHYLYL